MLEVFNRDRQRIAYLENAFDIYEDLKINAVNYLNFSIPADDPKTQHLQPFHYVKVEDRLYRILPTTLISEDTDILKIECEHVIATLIDKVMFGIFIIGNLGTYTETVLNFILSKQDVKHWRLGRCDFSRQFEYAWEHENLLSALFSVPKPIAEDYIWTFDTENYPWTINLERLDRLKIPDVYIQPKKNQIRLVRTSDPKQLFTKIYPLGYGEGVNQLTIKDVNGGIPYLEAPLALRQKYGTIERIWTDRRYENPQSLKDAAAMFLKEFQEPLTEYDISYQAIDPRETIKIGDKLRATMPDLTFDDFIIAIKYRHDDIPSSMITIANNPKNIATTIADLADRQRIEMSYSQGATQLYAQSIQANADTRNGAVINFFIPSEMRIVNKVLAKIKVDSFRAYSQATGGGGARSETTQSGGGSYSTTEWGGADYPTSNIGGQEVNTTTPFYMGGESVQADNDSYHWGTHNHGIPQGSTWSTNNYGIVAWTPSGAHNHGTHDHKVTTPGHSHSVNIRDHRHTITITAHIHNFSVPDHTHPITPGIFKFGSPKSFEIKVNNRSRGYYYSTSEELDITNMLLTDKNKITRGSWQSVEVIPNDLAYISIDLIIQGFVQSRGDNIL